MYTPKFTITNDILRHIGEIEAAKELIENAPLVPSFEKQFQSDAVMRTVHHGTHIEGNDLTFLQTKKVLEGETVMARARDIQEVVNYRNVVGFLDELAKISNYSETDLKEIQKRVVERIVDPTKIGTFRTTSVVIKNEDTGEVILRPPAFFDVPFLVGEFLTWLNSPVAGEVHPILKAGIAHYIISAIHPFIEGNGRTARSFANLVLIKDGFDIKKFFALEEHFDADPGTYYKAFSEVDITGDKVFDRDLTAWLSYFTKVVAVELVKIKEKVKRLSLDSRLKLKIGRQIPLSERQMRIVEYITDQGGVGMSTLKSVLRMVSEDTILRDVRDLVDKGILKKQGSTKAARYIMADK